IRARLTTDDARRYGRPRSHGYHTSWGCRGVVFAGSRGAAMRAPPNGELRSVKLSDQVTRALARRIANGEIGDDVQPPTESEICQEFGVSKTTAREVIRSLAERGFVEVRQGRRMQVRRSSEWNQLDPPMIELIDDPEVVRRYLADVHYVRTLIEPEVAARAALSADEDQVIRARRFV